MLTTSQRIEIKTITHTSTKADHSFINWVRMVAMFSIVVVHSLISPQAPAKEQDVFLDSYSMTASQETAMMFLGQCMRFGTLLFFIVSGYLLGHNLTQRSPITYYTRRVRVIFFPFLIAFSLFYGKSILYHFLNEPAVLTDFGQFAYEKFIDIFFDSPFWFIPNYFLSLAILLIFRNQLHKRWFAFVLISINLLYGINTHANWINARHNHALFGFVFYLWFGYKAIVGNWIAKSREILSTGALVLITALLYTGALFEGLSLSDADAIDPMNSLRIMNQLFAISLFFLLARNNYLSRIPFLNPRQESFGIYLYHSFFVNAVVRLTQHFAPFEFLTYHPDYSGLTLVVLSLLRGIIVYALTLLFVKAIAASRFRWLIGLHQIKQ
jgi:hypothetical protein